MTSARTVPTDLTRRTAAETAAAVAAGETSAVEVARAHLDRIDAVDGDVHAFLHVATDAALDGRRPRSTAAARPGSRSARWPGSRSGSRTS